MKKEEKELLKKVEKLVFEQMKDKHDSVGQVALKCGYDDANNFSRTFKREVGLKPTQYVANNKES